MLKLKTAVTKAIFLLFHDVVGMGSPLFFVPPYISGESSFQGNTYNKKAVRGKSNKRKHSFKN